MKGDNFHQRPPYSEKIVEEIRLGGESWIRRMQAR